MITHLFLVEFTISCLRMPHDVNEFYMLFALPRFCFCFDCYISSHRAFSLQIPNLHLLELIDNCYLISIPVWFLLFLTLTERESGVSTEYSQDKHEEPVAEPFDFMSTEADEAREILASLANTSIQEKPVEFDTEQALDEDDQEPATTTVSSAVMQLKPKTEHLPADQFDDESVEDKPIGPDTGIPTEYSEDKHEEPVAEPFDFMSTEADEAREILASLANTSIQEKPVEFDTEQTLEEDVQEPSTTTVSSAVMQLKPNTEELSTPSLPPVDQIDEESEDEYTKLEQVCQNDKQSPDDDAMIQSQDEKYEDESTEKEAYTDDGSKKHEETSYSDQTDESVKYPEISDDTEYIEKQEEAFEQTAPQISQKYEAQQVDEDYPDEPYVGVTKDPFEDEEDHREFEELEAAINDALDEEPRTTIEDDTQYDKPNTTQPIIDVNEQVAREVLHHLIAAEDAAAEEERLRKVESFEKPQGDAFESQSIQDTSDILISTEVAQSVESAPISVHSDPLDEKKDLLTSSFENIYDKTEIECEVMKPTLSAEKAIGDRFEPNLEQPEIMARSSSFEDLYTKKPSYDEEQEQFVDYNESQPRTTDVTNTDYDTNIESSTIPLSASLDSIKEESPNADDIPEATDVTETQYDTNMESAACPLVDIPSTPIKDTVQPEYGSSPPYQTYESGLDSVGQEQQLLAPASDSSLERSHSCEVEEGEKEHPRFRHHSSPDGFFPHENDLNDRQQSDEGIAFYVPTT
ncbi:unnamed protein product [Owenia fusiformis]|uniref:Uncharacterized protein n=1 Tax=Owenia fusiformis TaxID=6347 RepID=A0A8S4QBB9_OWEFU|nr:unnamed protein product [Owenia fusiformis]